MSALPDSDARGEFGDTEFVARVRSYCVVDHQLPGDLFCERRTEPATDEDCHEFVLFSLVVCFEFLAL
jgi:hypothetical protein